MAIIAAPINLAGYNKPDAVAEAIERLKGNSPSLVGQVQGLTPKPMAVSPDSSVQLGTTEPPPITPEISPAWAAQGITPPPQLVAKSPASPLLQGLNWIRQTGPDWKTKLSGGGV